MIVSVCQYFSYVQMEQYFNLEKDFGWEGFFVRTVKPTKRCLKQTVAQTRLTYDAILTVTTQVEMIIISVLYVLTEDLEID